MNRREWLAAGAAAGLVAGGVDLSAASQQQKKLEASFRFCMNTSTIRGQKIPLEDEVDLIAQAGFEGIEPWIGEIDTFTQSGGKLPDLKKRISYAGLTVASAIGFAEWIVDDDARRARGLEEAKRTMGLVAALGGDAIAAPPAGATDVENLNLRAAADRYAALIEVGRREGVTPQVELWGFSKALSRIGEVAFVATESGQPEACLLLDVYHIFKGGSAFDALKLLNCGAMRAMHINDYPAQPPRKEIADKDRVYPGDGVAPMNEILGALAASGFRGFLSLELFNQSYWDRPASEVVTAGLKKCREVVAAFEKSK